MSEPIPDLQRAAQKTEASIAKVDAYRAQWESVAAANKVGQAPPFARAVLDAKRRGVNLNVFVHAGAESWRRAKYRPQPHVLCCPPDAHFKQFDWSCVSGLELTLVVWDRPPAFVADFAQHLVRSGAALVAALNSFAPDGDVQLTIYKPRRVGA